MAQFRELGWAVVEKKSVGVSRLLGHASPTITLNVYSHMLPKEHYGSADRLNGLIYRNGAADL